MASDDTGRRAVVGEAIAAASARAGELAAGDEQLELLEAPTTRDGVTGEKVRAALERAGRGPGRPAGAQNRSTAALRSYLLARGADPLMHLAKWGMHTPESLAAELGCDQLEALRELRQIWAELAPYMHSRMLPTDAQGKPPPYLAFIFGGRGGAGGADRKPWEYLEQIQEVTGGEPAKSQDEKSHGGDK